jgi:hypothetical protein
MGKDTTAQARRPPPRPEGAFPSPHGDSADSADWAHGQKQPACAFCAFRAPFYLLKVQRFVQLFRGFAPFAPFSRNPTREKWQLHCVTNYIILQIYAMYIATAGGKAQKTPKTQLSIRASGRGLNRIPNPCAAILLHHHEAITLVNLPSDSFEPVPYGPASFWA